eukprot:403356986
MVVQIMQDNFERNLQTSVCDSSIKYFPVIIGGSEAECVRAVNLGRVMDADTDGRIAVAGYLSAAAGAQCIDYTSGRTVLLGFVSLLNAQGNIVWLNQASVGSEAKVPVLVALSGTTFYAMSTSLNANSYLRYIKIDAATGNVLAEIEGDSMFTSATLYHNFRVDRSNKDLYHKFVIQSTTLSFSEQRSIIIKLNSNLVVQWIKTLYCASVNQVYTSLEINVDSPDIWQLSRIFTTASSTSTYTLTKNYLLNSVLLDLQLYVAQTTGNFIIFGRLLTSTSINLVSAAKAGSNFIIGITSTAYLTTKTRIVLIGIKDDAYSTSASCLNFTTPTYATLTDLGTSGSTTSATALYSADNEAFTFNTVDSADYTLQSGSVKYPDIAVMRDTSVSQHCDLPLIVTPSSLFMDTSPTTFTITEIKDCSGTIYKFTAASWPDGAGTSEISINTAAQTLTITITSQTIREALGNFYAIRLTVVNDNVSRFAYVNVENNMALKSSARDPSTPNHNVSACTMPIYPLLYGGMTVAQDVNIVHFNVDQYGNMLLAGSAQKQPFNFHGETYVKGYISYMDQRATPYWTHTVIGLTNYNANGECTFATQSGAFIYGLCRQTNEWFLNTILKQPAILKLQIRTGSPVWYRMLPQDNTNPTLQTPIFMEILSSNKILVLYKYQWTTPAYQNFVALKFDQTTFTSDYFNFYPVDTGFTYPMHFLVDTSGTYFFQFRHQGTSKELIQQIRITDGVVERQALINTINSEDQKMQQTFYGTDKIILPIIQTGTQDTFQFFVLNKADLSKDAAFQLVFPSTANLASATITTDSSQNIYITLGQNQLYFAKLDSSYTFTEGRMWKGDFTEAYYAVNSRVHGSNQFHAFYGRYSTSTSFQTLIFKFGNWSQTCFDVPILLPTETNYYPTYSTVSTNPTITTVSNVELAAPLPTDNFPLLALIQSIKQSSLSYSPTKQYVWGLQSITGKYRRYPYSGQICSPIELVAALKDSNTYEFTQATGTKSITFTTDFKNCQDRPTTALILNPFTDTQSMKQPGMYTASNNVLNVLTNAFAQPISHNIKLRYQDTTYTSYYWDNYVHIRVVNSVNVSQPIQWGSERCAQNPWPIALGKQALDLTNTYLNSFIGNDDDKNIVINGQARYNNLFTLNEGDYHDGFLARIQQNGGVVWWSQMTFLFLQDEFGGSSLMLMNEHVYAFIATFPGNTATRYHMVVKVTYSEGKLIYSKQLVTRSLIDTQANLFYRAGDMQVNPRNTSQFFTQYSVMADSFTTFVPGGIMFYEDGRIVSTFDYQLKVLSGCKSSLGQVLYDPIEDYMYVGYMTCMISTTYQNMIILKMFPQNGTIVWSKQYENLDMGQTPSNQDRGDPVLKYNKKSLHFYAVFSYGNIQIVKFDSSGTTKGRVQIRISSHTTLQTDIAMNHDNGNLIIVSVTESYSYIEYITLDENFVAVTQTFQGHPYWFSNNVRLIQQFSDGYFMIAQHSQYFGTPYAGEQITISKKSLNLYEFYKYECHNQLYVYSPYSVINTYTSNSGTLSAANFYMNIVPLELVDVPWLWFRQMSQYYSQAYPFSEYSTSYYFSGTPKTCASGGGLQPPPYIYDTIELTQGETVTYTFNSTNKQNCQGYSTVIYTVYDETDSSTRSATNNFITITGTSSIQIDATGSVPYPGIRWIHVRSYTAQNSLWTDPSFIKVVVWPATKPAASSSSAPTPVCEGHEARYPRIYGQNDGHNIIYWADIDQTNGNVLICGETTSSYRVLNYRYNKNSFISLIDQNMQVQWAWSTGFTDSSYAAWMGSCEFATNEFIFALNLINYDNVLAISKHEYATGQTMYIKRISGKFHQSQFDYQLRVDTSDNSVYVAGMRLDWNQQMHYVTKIDVTTENDAVQQYYIEGRVNGWGTSVYYLPVRKIAFSSESDGYFISSGYIYQYYEASYRYLQLGFFNKLTGQFLGSKHFKSNTLTDAPQVHDVLISDPYIYVGFSQYGSGYCVKQVSQMNNATRAIIKGIEYNVQGCGSYFFNSFDADDTYLYEAFHCNTNKLIITQFDKVTLAIIQMKQHYHSSGSFYERVFFRLYLGSLFIFGNTYTGFMLDSSYYVGFINKIESTFETPNSCMEFYPYPYPRPVTTNTLMYDQTGAVSFTTVLGSAKTLQLGKHYSELLNITRFNLKDPILESCYFSAPQFQTKLEDQIFTLPIDPTDYKFDWPTDCFASELKFTWSVDKYTTAPSFLTMSNDTSSSTLTMSPANTDVGTYIVRVTFTKVIEPDVSFSDTFVVEIYPSVAYGSTNLNENCPTRTIPINWYKEGNQQTYGMDLSQGGDNILICGAAKDYWVLTTSYYQGFFQSYTKGPALNFHLTLDIGSALSLVRECQFDLLGNIMTMTSAATSSVIDRIIFMQHTGNGKYIQGKQMYYKDKMIIGLNMYYNLINGDYYVTGQHQNDLMTFDSQISNFIMRMTSDFVLIFFRNYDAGYKFQGYDLAVDASAGYGYQLFQFYHQNGCDYWGIQGFSVIDGSNQWHKTLRDTSANDAYQDSAVDDSQQGGIAYSGAHLYSCFSYYRPSFSSGELYFGKHSLTDGSLIQGVDLAYGYVNTVTCEFSSASEQVIFMAGLNGISEAIVFNVAVTPFTWKTKTITATIPSTFFSRIKIFERSNSMWIYLRAHYGAIADGRHQTVFAQVKDLTNFVWDQTCTNFQNMNSLDFNIPNGIGVGVFNIASSWINMATFYTREVELDQVYRLMSNIKNIRFIPITNLTADFRLSYSGCLHISKPTKPVQQDRIGDPINATAGGLSVGSLTYKAILSTWLHCTNEPLTLDLKISPSTALPTWMVFNSTGSSIDITPNSNSLVNVYTLRFKASVTKDTTFFDFIDFKIEIIKNKPPIPFMDFLSPVVTVAHHDTSWVVSFNSDFEYDTAIFSAQVLNNLNSTINSTISWFKVTQSDDQGIEFSVINPPQPITGQTQTQYYIKVSVWDQYNVATPNEYFINYIVKRNYVPYNHQPLNFTLDTIVITKAFTHTFWYQNFTDDEGDNLLISCAATTTGKDTTWIKFEYNLTVDGNITFYGDTPRNNEYNGTYTIACTVKDQWDGTPNVYNFSLIVLPKDQIIITGTYTRLYVRLPDNIKSSYTSYDNLGELNYYSLYVNNTLYDPAVFWTWFKWWDTNQSLTVYPYSNSQGGNHSLSIKFDDLISVPMYINITLEVKQNWPLRVIKPLDNVNAITKNAFQYDYNKDEIFFNPEGEPFIMYFREADTGNKLPYFVTKNFSNGTIGGFTTDQDIGIYNLECVGIDDAFWETVIPFTLRVKPCYYKCQTCWDSDYNQCFTCKPNFFFNKNECLDQCMDGTYADTIEWACKQCPYQCRICTGNDPLSQCQKCATGYFKMGDGCYDKCPDGYWGDQQDYTCKQCNSACTLCYGPSSLQCTKCANLEGVNEIGKLRKIGYLLSGTECKIPKCPEGQFFKWEYNLVKDLYFGQCQTCHSRCRKCTGASELECVQCYQGSILNSTLHTCKYCHEITGLFTNEELECEDICGDGILITKQCDDGNALSGDGCNDKCVVEYGFACPIPGIPCKETIPPTFRVSSINAKNLIYVEFSEPIQIFEETALSPDNIQIEITGKATKYKFSWRMINDVKNPLLPGRIINKFAFVSSEFQQSLDGSEKYKITFQNYSAIQDLAGNPVAAESYAEINVNSFVFLSASEQSTISSGGSSLKYTFMSVFSFNLVLKVVLNSSMQYLWGLVHALQVFNFLLYMNIDFPNNVQTFSGYLKVASGDIEEMQQYIPNIADYIVNIKNVESSMDNEKLQQKFIDDDVPPYFIVAFGQKLTLWCIAFLIILPFSLVLNKLCKKVKLWEEIIGAFFFNLPLRTFIEMYIELILQVVVNTQFVKFKNLDQMITTLIAFIFGAISLLLPFMAMTLIYHNRRIIKSKKWKMKFGMLTDECRSKSILQLYYYPLFMYQRLFIAGIIVYVYDMPLLQCLMVMACNLAMIVFLVIIRPFKEESQQTTTVLDEIVIMVCVGLFIKLYQGGPNMDPSSKKDLGWGIIGLIMFSVCKNFGVVIYFGIQKTQEKLRKMFSADDQLKDSPHTSDEDDMLGDNDMRNDLDTEEILQEIQEERQKNQFSVGKQNKTNIFFNNSQSDLSFNNQTGANKIQPRYNPMQTNVIKLQSMQKFENNNLKPIKQQDQLNEFSRQNT